MNGGFISVKGDVKQVTKYLSDVQKKQIPFATALALTNTAKAAQRAVNAQMEKEIDRPTPYTKRAIGIQAANKQTLTSKVFVKPEQFAYLKYIIEGGTRQTSGTTVPTRATALNQYGNIKGKRGGLVKNASRFISSIGGTPAIWERFGKKRGQIRPIAFIVANPHYSIRFHFDKIVAGVASNTFTRHMTEALAKALASAK